MEDLSLHIMDIVQNSITAGADQISVRIAVEGEPLKLICEIVDNGKGMVPDFLKKVEDPFETSRTTRDVGMGIPLLKQSAEMAGGRLSIKSEPLRGTSLRAEFEVRHIDRIPLGDIAETIKLLVMAHPQITWVAEFTSGNEKFRLDTGEIRQYMDGVPLNNHDVLNWIQKTIENGIKKVFGGVLDEVG